jgi:hypothetical protein
VIDVLAAEVQRHQYETADEAEQVLELVLDGDRVVDMDPEDRGDEQ